eukprot:TRINITY_DN5381_c0_g1_i1.p1 TRINITY_DN5381_c0_g1~~TRINITY_DN5381_c0_g1_i1.p1  ORF type:complete len:257 (-),score=45.09 TRINITY_DN5381_c0_g1_i1:51-821(-)
MEEPNDNVFIADLPIDCDEKQLHAIFSEYGSIVSCRMLNSDRDLKNGKRAGLVRFGKIDEARWVVESLNGNIPQGLNEPIIVRYKSAPTPGKSGGKGGFKAFGGAGRPGPYPGGSGVKAGGGKSTGKGGNKGASMSDIRELVNGLTIAGVLPGGSRYENDENALFVAGLPINTTDLDLYKIFSPFGPIAAKGVKAMPGSGGYGTCSGIGFVNFLNAEASHNAVQILNGTGLPDGSLLRVSRKAPSGGRIGGKGDGK